MFDQGEGSDILDAIVAVLKGTKMSIASAIPACIPDWASLSHGEPTQGARNGVPEGE